jgi:hypothetical protein
MSEEFKIGEPVSEVPIGKNNHGKYLKIWAAVKELQEGAWLPIQCPDDESRRRLLATAYTNRVVKVEIKVSDKIVFLKRKL